MVPEGQEILGQPRGSALVPGLRGHRPIPGKGSGLRLHVHHLYHWVSPADMDFPLMAVISEIQKGESLMEEFWSLQSDPRSSAPVLWKKEVDKTVPTACFIQRKKASFL